VPLQPTTFSGQCLSESHGASFIEVRNQSRHKLAKMNYYYDSSKLVSRLREHMRSLNFGRILKVQPTPRVRSFSDQFI